MVASGRQRDLFDTTELPSGLVYREGFLSPAEEQSLTADIQALPLQEARYRIFMAKRRIMSFGCASAHIRT